MSSFGIFLKLDNFFEKATLGNIYDILANKYSGNQNFWPKLVLLNILVIPKALISVFSTFTEIQEIEMSAWPGSTLCCVKPETIF